MGIQEYRNRDYVFINGKKVEHLCKSCVNQDTNWRVKMNCVRIYCSDYQPIPEFVLKEKETAPQV